MSIVYELVDRYSVMSLLVTLYLHYSNLWQKVDTDYEMGPPSGIGVFRPLLSRITSNSGRGEANTRSGN